MFHYHQQAVATPCSHAREANISELKRVLRRLAAIFAPRVISHTVFPEKNVLRFSARALFIRTRLFAPVAFSRKLFARKLFSPRRWFLTRGFLGGGSSSRKLYIRTRVISRAVHPPRRNLPVPPPIDSRKKQTVLNPLYTVQNPIAFGI